MTITANMVSLSLSTVGPPGSDALVSLLGVDAGIPASVRTVVVDGWLRNVLMDLRASPLLNRLPYIFLGERCPVEFPDKASVNCIALS